MKVVDFHNHYYPPAYLKALQEGPSNYRVSTDQEGNPVLESPGDVNIVVRGHRDLHYRTQVLDRAGVDRQVISFTAPGTLLETPERSAELARLVNDELAAAREEFSSRFLPLGTLPLNHPREAYRELIRLVEELHMPGVMLFSNANGVPLSDECFWPLYEIADAHCLPLFIHPTYPVGVEAMSRFWLMPLVGFLFDTTLAAASLVFRGVVERFPDIPWVLAHLGGAIPYLAERLDRGFFAFSECRRYLERPPSQHLRRFYYDTVNFDPEALRLAIRFAGPERILAGSDYPHQIGSLEKMLESLKSLELPPAPLEAVLGQNAEKLLRV